MKTQGQRACYYSLLITALFVGFYWLGHGIALPGINGVYFSSFPKIFESRVAVSIFALGYAPFLTGFVIVEMFSLIVPAGRRLRSNGGIGRAKLNRAGIAVSFLICIYQSFAVALALERSSLDLVSSPGWPFRLVTCVTLTAGSLSIFLIARLISSRGMANGFCILIALDTLAPVIRQFNSGADFSRTVGLNFSIEYFGLMAVVLLLLFVYYTRVASVSARPVESQRSLGLDLPTFPQGGLPLTFTYYIFGLYPLIYGFQGSGSIEQPVGFWPLLVGTVLLVAIFSVVGVVMFSSRKRIVYNLPRGVRVDDNFERLLRNQAIRGAAVLAIGAAIFIIIERRFQQSFLPNYAGLIVLVAIVLDVIEQWRFSWKQGRGVELIELDNVHLASYLKGLLKLNGINAVIQTYRYRQLLFFFGPLTKMRILVATEDSERAREQIDWESIQII